MRILLIIFILLAISSSYLFGQQQEKEIEGVVTYLTTQNIYVKFKTTKGIKKGDTLYSKKDGKLIPALVVEFVSSASCAGKPIGTPDLKATDMIIAIVSEKDELTEKEIKQAAKPISEAQDSVIKNYQEKQKSKKQKIEGRISALSYLNFSNTSAADIQRMRYTVSLRGSHIAESKFSIESYVSFAHKINDWAAIQDNIYNGLKVYDLSLNYELSKQTNIWAGRKINPRISSLGAIDGLQFETAFKKVVVGAVVGFRPDYTDYSFNGNLLEYGAYLGHNYVSKTGSMQTSLAFFQQTNRGNIDRRFAYFQYDNSLLKNVNLFVSSELDLYQMINGQASSNLSLTSLYLSLRYRINHKMSIFTSYDTRKNVIYYETYKSYLDQLLEDATRQGIQLRMNYRPFKRISTGINAGYRFRTNDIKPTENTNGFISYSQVPWINTSATLSANWLQNSYLKGMIYGLLLSKDFMTGKLSSDVNLRYVDYNMDNLISSKRQMIGEIGLQYRATKRLSFSVDYEGTFEQSIRYDRVYLNLTKRF